MDNLLKVLYLVSIVLSALVLGVFWGPWIALSRSFATFKADIFLEVVKRMNKNLEPVMTVLMPVTILSIILVLFFSFNVRSASFYLTLLGLVFFVISLIVTMIVEVPIVKQIASWDISTIPNNWQELRDKWISFHSIRILSGLLCFVLLLCSVIFLS